jgi:PAS domain S-box-containing protein
LRVLVVDAERESARRLARTLARSHPELDLHPVGTTAAALEVLQRRHGESEAWDAVLCTVGRRHPEGLELARTLFEGVSRLPLVLVGESVDIEAAVEGMKVGASDFLVRGPHLSRHLVPRLRQVVDRTRSRLRRDLLLPALDALPGTVLVVDERGSIVAVSRTCQMTFGMGEEELTGQPLRRVLELAPQDRLPAELQALEPAASLERPIRARRGDGREFRAQLTAVRMQGAEPLLMLVIRAAEAAEAAAGAGPQAPRPEPARPATSLQARVGPEPLRVLLVDDEDAILELLADVLGSEGHNVETARSGEAAMRKLDGGSYDLLITDLRLPGLDGRQLCERWSTQHPEGTRRVLITTGDTASEATREYLQRSGLRYLLKPFDIEQLKSLIRSVLEESRDPGGDDAVQRASGSLRPEPEVS